MSLCQSYTVSITLCWGTGMFAILVNNNLDLISCVVQLSTYSYIIIYLLITQVLNKWLFSPPLTQPWAAQLDKPIRCADDRASGHVRSWRSTMTTCAARNVSKDATVLTAKRWMMTESACWSLSALVCLMAANMTLDSRRWWDMKFGNWF